MKQRKCFALTDSKLTFHTLNVWVEQDLHIKLLQMLLTTNCWSKTTFYFAFILKKASEATKIPLRPKMMLFLVRQKPGT